MLSVATLQKQGRKQIWETQTALEAAAGDKAERRLTLIATATGPLANDPIASSSLPRYLCRADRPTQPPDLLGLLCLTRRLPPTAIRRSLPPRQKQNSPDRQRRATADGGGGGREGGGGGEGRVMVGRCGNGAGRRVRRPAVGARERNWVGGGGGGWESRRCVLDALTPAGGGMM